MGLTKALSLSCFPGNNIIIIIKNTLVALYCESYDCDLSLSNEKDPFTLLFEVFSFMYSENALCLN